MASYSAGASSSSSWSRSGTYMVPGMDQVYSQLLDLNRMNYGNILSAFSQGIGSLASGYMGSQQNYSNLYQGVLSTLGLDGKGWGYASPAANAISEQFTRARGAIQQSMVGSGLGNSTVAAALQNQNALQASRAYSELGARLAGTAADYLAQFGMASQQHQQQYLQQYGNTLNNLISTLGRFQFGNTAGNLTGLYSGSGSSSSSAQVSMSR